MLSELEQSPAQRILTDLGISQTEAATWFGLDSSSLCRKLAGNRPWLDHEIKLFLAKVSRLKGRKVSFEEAFGPVRRGRR